MSNTDPWNAPFSALVTAGLLIFLICISIVYFSSIQSLFFVPTALISFELIAVLLLIAFLRPYIFAIVYIAILSVHTLFAVAPAYHLSIKSIGAWLISIGGLPLQEQLYGILFIALLAIVITFLASQVLRYSRSIGVTISTVFILLAISLITDRFIEPRVGRNLVDSDILSLSKVYRKSRASLATSQVGGKLESATEVLFEALEAQKPLPKKVLLVMVESFGLGNQQLNKLQYIDIIESRLEKQHSDIRYFKVPFAGSTVPGEYRELCQRYIDQPIFSVPESVKKNCLARLFTQKGYRSSAYHGFGGGFFDRMRLYREFGFDKLIFANTLKKTFNLNNTCGYLIFEGLCDLDVAKVIANQLISSSSPEFMYWLTLNGHQPTMDSPNMGEYQSCSKMKLAEDRVCRTVQHAQVVINTIVDIAISAPETAIVIVGDHSPGTHQGTFSNEYVPAITIWPGSIND